MKKPLILIIMDGFGINESDYGNAIHAADKPNIDRLFARWPKTQIGASGMDVGLPDGQMGNSEVGHTNIGAGRIVYQELTRITKTMHEGGFAKNEAFTAAIENCRKNGSALHLMGLLSDGGVHSHNSHLYGLLRMAKEAGLTDVYVHCFMDGRDVPPSSGKEYVEELLAKMEEIGVGKIATVMGRYYAMDRDKRWDRVEAAYNAIALGEGKHAASADEAIAASYKDGVTDEFVVPCVIGDYKGLEEGDAVLMANFRADRAREILYALADREFTGFARKKEIRLSMAVGLTEYSVDHNRFMKTMFGPEALKNIFGEVVADHGLTQLRIAETEKYAHVTFFFNGGEEKEFPGESRILVPSPKVATYDLKPEMSVYEVTDNLVDAIENKKFDVIICNFANGDMVGHTGKMDAVLKAVAAVDECLGRVVKAIKDVDGVLLVTADHGNAEKMVDEKTGEPYTAHTVGKVQAILINGPKEITAMKDGKLADISPTLLELLNIPQPKEMNGQSLLVK